MSSSTQTRGSILLSSLSLSSPVHNDRLKRGASIMRRWLVRLGVVLGMLLAARDAFAADAAWDACLEGTADKMISGCTEVLSRGWGETQADLAVAYRGRGLGNAEKREYTQAIADLSEAIRLAAKDD